jgi:hypothetical protein
MSREEANNLQPKATSSTAQQDIEAIEQCSLSPSIPPLGEHVLEKSSTEKSNHGNVVAKEDYSVFTVPEKRAIIFFSSFTAWFSPMSGAIYYPAINQVFNVCLSREANG